MTKKKALLPLLLFCLFFGGLSILGLLLPDRSFSPRENRELQQAPVLRMQSILRGSFMSQTEDWFSDQMALRDQWVSLQARCERLLGKKENGGVYFASGDTLIRRVEEPERDAMLKKADCLNTLAENIDVPVYYALIPSAAEVWEDRLPKGARTADEEAWIEALYAQSSAETVDMLTPLREHSEEDIFYRTDHHWTSRGAYIGARTLCDALGIACPGEEALTPTAVSRDFFGTNAAASGADWVSPDVMETLCSPEGVTVETTLTDSEGTGGLYVPSRLETRDKYAFFLGGNQPRCVIRTGNEGPRLLLIRDSYADSMVPFLTEGCSEIHLLDLRYFRESVAEYVEQQDIDAVVLIYGFSTYASDSYQALLTM